MGTSAPSPARRWRVRRLLAFLVAPVIPVASCLGALFLPGTGAPAEAASSPTSSCAQFDVVPVENGLYDVQTNEWNSAATQCVTTDGGADFTVTASAIDTGTTTPGSYPSIYRGCHWGTCTVDSGLPIQVSGIGDPTTSWSTTEPASGVYDVAYDLWFDSAPSTDGAPDGGEMMVWLSSNGAVQPAGSPVGTVNLDGYSFTVWYDPSQGSGYFAYVVNADTTSVSNLDLGNLVRDALSRGFLSPSSYLISVEAGFEIWQGGAGLETNSFSFYPSPSTSAPAPASGPEPPASSGPEPPASSCQAGSAAGAFVCSLYDDILGRTPDPAGLDGWAESLQAGTSRTEVAYEIATSTEARQDLLAADYQSFLGRALDPGGLDAWLSAFASGATDEQVEAGILGSAEFYADSGYSAAGFVNALYEALLGRPADPGGLATWVSQLQAGTRTEVAYEVATSPEANADVVEHLYRLLLGRPADPSGLSTFGAALASGSTYEQVLAAICGSAEFYDDATSG